MGNKCSYVKVVCSSARSSSTKLIIKFCVHNEVLDSAKSDCETDKVPNVGKQIVSTQLSKYVTEDSDSKA